MEDIRKQIKSGDYFNEAMIVLKTMQKRDFDHLDNQMDMAKDEIITDLTFGRLALTIPYDHYEVLTMMYPDLQHEDATEKTLAWKKFMATEVSLPYKNNKKQRKL